MDDAEEFRHFFEQAERQRKAGQFQEAIASYRNATEIRPGHARSHYNSGLCYYRMKNYQQALREFRRAMEFKPGSESVRISHDKTVEKMRSLKMKVPPWSPPVPKSNIKLPEPPEPDFTNIAVTEEGAD